MISLPTVNYKHTHKTHKYNTHKNKNKNNTHTKSNIHTHSTNAQKSHPLNTQTPLLEHGVVDGEGLAVELVDEVKVVDRQLRVQAPLITAKIFALSIFLSFFFFYSFIVYALLYR